MAGIIAVTVALMGALLLTCGTRVGATPSALDLTACANFTRESNSSRYHSNSYFIILNSSVSFDLNVTLGAISFAINLRTLVNVSTPKVYDLTTELGIVILLYNATYEDMSAVFDGRITLASPLQALLCVHANSMIAVDQGIEATGTTQLDPPWHLDRIDQRGSELDSSYSYSNVSRGGEGVHVYVVDTGIKISHPDFEGRASTDYNAVSGENGLDCNGHGTHVAGIIGSAEYGVAKKSRLHSVKVFGCTGDSGDSAIADGLFWILKNGQRPGVVSMSFGGPLPEGGGLISLRRLETTTLFVQALLTEGFTCVIAAGNSASDACDFTPAAKGEDSAAITVMASSDTDTLAYYSNYGACTNIIAPGSRIVSLGINSNTAVKSGTSMACPVISGIAALHLAEESTLTPQEVKNRILSDASNGKIRSLPSRSPNKLGYSRYSLSNASTLTVGLFLMPLLVLAIGFVY